MKIAIFNSILSTFIAIILISCSKDDDKCPVANPLPENNSDTNTVVDIDNNTYKTIKIGGQVWMKENLKTTRYSNGDLIPTGLDTTQWNSATTGAWAYYNDSAQYNNPFGKLYNWYAVADPRGVCPSGWRVPTQSDFNVLVKYLDVMADTSCGFCPQSLTAGGLLKDSGEVQLGSGLWQSPNLGANNLSGFTALPGGRRDFYGKYTFLGIYGNVWSETEYTPNRAWTRFLNCNTSRVTSYDYSKQHGFSVRCIKN